MQKKSKVLFVSYYYPPNNAIGAVRPSKMIEKLTQDGYEIDLFTYGYTDNDTFEETETSIKKYVVNSQKRDVNLKTASLKKKKESRLLAEIKRHYITFLSMKRDKVFMDKFKKTYDEMLSRNSYEAVFTTFGPLCALQAGLYVKKKNPEVKWICDFRDPVVVEFSPKLFRPYFRYLQNKACKKADCVVAVSAGYLKRICRKKYKDKSYMIPNGYDLRDRVHFSDREIDNSYLRIVYVGALYLGKRDLSPVFKVLSELIDEKKIDRNKVVFEYAGSEFHVLEAQAERYGVESILHNNSKLPRKECLELQFLSHLLVLSTWNNKGEEGVFPGKFLEYMLIGRPILAVVDGNLKNSEVKQVMSEGRFGITYESACDSEDFGRLKDYIKEQYNNVMLGDGVHFSPEQSVLDRYNYDNIIKRIEALIK